jgi:transketolase
MIPNMDVWRPCDTVESFVAWVAAIERRDGPSSLLFSRQNLAFQARDAKTIAMIRRGGYVLSDATSPRALILATGSEVALAMEAQKALAAESIAVRVVSMPSTNVFDRQDAEYRASVLTPGLPRVAVEAGVTGFWHKYTGAADSRSGAVVGIDRFGESAPGPELFKYFGFTAEHVVQAVKSVL